MKIRLIALLTLLVVLVAFSGCTQKQSEPAPADTSAPVEEGLSEDLKKEVYFELVKYQDGISFEDLDYAQKQQGAYQVIADRYGIEESEVRKIVTEGIKKDWPMPPPPKY